jgi:integrase
VHKYKVLPCRCQFNGKAFLWEDFMPRKKQKRRPGEGSVYRRSDGRWVCEITLEDHSRKQYYFKTEKEALARKQEALDELAKGILAVGPQQTVQQFLEYWLEDVYKPTVRLSTFRNCRILVNKHIIPAIGHIKLQKLTMRQVQSFYAKKLRDGAKASRVKSIHTTLHTALEHARLSHLVSANVTSDIRVPQREKSEKQPLTPDQIVLLLQAAKGYQLEGLLVLAIATGMRQGEILGLRWSDIDLELGMLRVSRTVTYVTGYGCVEGEPKTAKSKRNIMLPQFVTDTLNRHRVNQAEKKTLAGLSWIDRNLVFPNHDGDFLISVTLLRRFRRLLKEVGLPCIRFHDLRHSAATLLLGMGVSLKVVQELLGHSSIDITADIYSHVLPPIHREAMDKMGHFFNNRVDDKKDDDPGSSAAPVPVSPPSPLPAPALASPDVGKERNK